MERTAVERVLIEAHNLIDSGHDRINIGGIWICWYCGQPDRQHDNHCFIKSLTEAMNAYHETPHYILSLDPQSKTRQDFDALHGAELGRVKPPLSGAEYQHIKLCILQHIGLTTREKELLLAQIEWQGHQLDCLQGDQTFRSTVKDLLEKMRELGGDGVGLAMYLYRKGGNQRPDGDPIFAERVQGIVKRLETVWGMLGGDPRRKG